MKKFIVLDYEEISEAFQVMRREIVEIFVKKMQQCNHAQVSHALNFVSSQDETERLKSLVNKEAEEELDTICENILSFIDVFADFAEEKNSEALKDFDVTILQEVFKNRAPKHADSIEPNHEGEMVDETQWHHNCDSYQKGAMEVIEYIAKNFEVNPIDKKNKKKVGK